MSNRQFNFQLWNGTQVSKSFQLVPIDYPKASNPFIITGDPIPVTGSPALLNLQDNRYKVEYNTSQKSNTWLANLSGSNITASKLIFSGSLVSGSMATCFFDFANSKFEAQGARKVVIWPVNSNISFNEYFILGDSLTYSTNASGFFTLNLVPITYNGIFEGCVKNTSFQFTPSGSCTASALITANATAPFIIKPPGNQSSYYTKEAADGRFLQSGSNVSANQISCSWASSSLSASFASTASFVVTASYALSASQAKSSSFARHASDAWGLATDSTPQKATFIGSNVVITDNGIGDAILGLHDFDFGVSALAYTVETYDPFAGNPTGFIDVNKANGVATWSSSVLVSSADISPDSVTSFTVAAQTLKTSGTPGVAPFTNTLGLDGSGFLSTGNISWDTVGNLYVGPGAKNKIGQDGAGWLADNAIHWDTTGRLTAPDITGSLFGTAKTASFVTTAQTASYVTSSRIVGTIISATSASLATKAISSSYFSGSTITASGITANSLGVSGITNLSNGQIVFDTLGNFTMQPDGNMVNELSADGGGVLASSNIVWDSNGNLTTGDLTSLNLIVNGDTTLNGNLLATGHCKFGDGTDIAVGPAYMVATSAGGNAGFLASRNNLGAIVSHDLLNNVDPSTGWSIQMQASDNNLAIVDRVNNVNMLYLTSGGGLTVTGGITSSLKGTATTASFVTTAQTASFVTTATTASYVQTAQTSSNGAKAWGNLSYNGSTLVSSVYRCSVSRISAGLYGVTLNPAAGNSNYAVTMNGFSGSTSTPTGSMGYSIGQTTTNFSMSFQTLAAPLVRADFSTASFATFSY